MSLSSRTKDGRWSVTFVRGAIPSASGISNGSNDLDRTLARDMSFAGYLRNVWKRRTENGKQRSSGARNGMCRESAERWKVDDEKTKRERERERVSEWGWAAARSRGTRGGGVAFWHDMCRSSLARDLRLDWLPLIRESGLWMRGEFRDYKYQRYREPGPRGRLDSKWNRRRSRGLPRPQKQLRQTDSRVLCSLSPRVYATIRFKPR